ncbi:MAG TPA: methyltransferase domain-containing protein [Methylomirabilota bacterium]|nr:methyltransferase domain-containing protein [Methylomirabilota bacterium]
MGEHAQWQLDGSAPELYERYIVPAVTALWAADLVEWASPEPGERVLDVACGTGVVARLAAERVAVGRVVGLDINAGMLAVARSLPPRAGPSIQWLEGSALGMPFPDAAFDLVFCQLGLQFFPDRPAALREMRRVLAPGGRLALNVYGSIEHNPVAHVLADALDRHLGPRASASRRSEHALADVDELCGLVDGAGFRDVTIRTTTQRIRFPSSREYVRITLAATPLAGMVSGWESGQREALVEALAGELTASLRLQPGEGELTFPQEAHVLLARN